MASTPSSELPSLSDTLSDNVLHYQKFNVIPADVKSDEEKEAWAAFANELEGRSARTQALRYIFQEAFSRWTNGNKPLDKLQDLYNRAKRQDIAKGQYIRWIKNLLLEEKMDSLEGVLLREYIKQPDIQEHIDNAALQYSLSSWTIQLQLLLHLPRFRIDELLQNNEIITSEIDILGSRLAKKYSKYRHLLNEPEITLEAPQQTEFGRVPEEQAKVIHETFHYIGSFRENSLHFGLYTDKPRQLAALLSFSPYDLHNMTQRLPDEIRPEEVMVLSRGFAFCWAPKNWMSFLAAQVVDWFKQYKPETKMFLTYVNPNLGFTGAAYRASNWVKFGEELGTTYAYQDGKYITDRELLHSSRTGDPIVLNKKSAITESQLNLAPLLVYSYFIKCDLRKRHIGGRGLNHVFSHPRDHL